MGGDRREGKDLTPPDTTPTPAPTLPPSWTYPFPPQIHTHTHPCDPGGFTRYVRSLRGETP